MIGALLISASLIGAMLIGATLMIVVYGLIRTEGPPINEVPIISALSASFPA